HARSRVPNIHSFPTRRSFDRAIPVSRRADGISIRIIAGTGDGLEGAVSGIATEPTYLDVSLPTGASFSHELPPGHAAFVYAVEGERKSTRLNSSHVKSSYAVV